MEDIKRAYDVKSVVNTISRQPSRFAQFASAERGRRVSPRALQQALLNEYQAQVALLVAQAIDQKRLNDLSRRHDLFREVVNTHLKEVEATGATTDEVRKLRIVQQSLNVTSQLTDALYNHSTSQLIELAECFPKTTGFAPDVIPGLRAKRRG